MITKVFISGVFNVLHPGHFRILEFAKSQGDILMVGILPDSQCGNYSVEEEIRLKNLKSVSYVDEVFILKNTPLDYIKKNKPEIIIKGNEYKNMENPELNIINSYNGKLIFSSGEIKETNYKDKLDNNIERFIFPNEFLDRHSIDLGNIRRLITKFSEINVAVFGDIIIDNYINCQGVGMSREEPTIVMRPINSSKYLGGAGIVAKHAAKLKSNVDFYSISGEDKEYEFVINDLSSNNVNHFIVKDLNRPTTQKLRYKANNNTVFRINDYSENILSKNAENLIYNKFLENINKYDMVILSDFSYGALSPNLINNIIKISNKNNLIVASDSQSSSQIGDITKFKKSTIITPTEHEARLALKNNDDGIFELAKKLRKVCMVQTVLLTLGSEGVLIVTDENGNEDLKTDIIPSLQKNVIDLAGAGDALLVGMSLSKAINANIWEATFIGSLCAGIQISRQGSVPINLSELVKVLKN